VAEIVPYLALGGGFAAILAGVAWVGSRARRRGVGAAFVGPAEEIFRPTAHHVRFDIQAQDERRMPVSSPGDPCNRGKSGQTDVAGQAQPLV
jgi:hypothetical protein